MRYNRLKPTVSVGNMAGSDAEAGFYWLSANRNPGNRARRGLSISPPAAYIRARMLSAGQGWGVVDHA